jgi:bifunctional DNA-binding transcriptional regulator/antitoxin component of YhaV-PrlF toxin-antitoxin module
MICVSNIVGEHGSANVKSLYVTIPIEWVRKHDVKKGDRLIIKEMPDGSLRVIIPEE